MLKIPILLILFFTYEKTICQTVDTVFVFKPPIKKNIKSLTLLDTIFDKSDIIIASADSGKLDTISIRSFNVRNEMLYEGKYVLSKVDTISAIYEYVNGERKKETKRMRLIYLREGYWYNYKKGKLQSTYYFEGEKLKQKI